jgi:hypothetical protein
MKLIFNKDLGTIIGTASGANKLLDCMIYLDQPEGFDITQINDYALVDGVLTIDLQAALSRAKVQKVRAIRAYFDSIVTGLKASVAAYEVATWDTQRTELTAYLANANNPTPYVDSLAAARGETRDVMFGKIKSKVEAMAALQGKQQALEKQAEAATDMGTLNAITY